MTAVMCASLAGVAAALFTPGSRLRRRNRPAAPQMADPRVMRILAIALGFVAALVVGGLVGLAVGVAIALLLPVGLGRLETGQSRRRREQIERHSAMCADLLASCLIAGAPLGPAARAVADALGAPVAEPLRAMVSALHLGSDPVQAWSWVAAEPALAPIARAASRAAETGAPLAPLLVGIADDLRQAERSRGEAAARAAGVRAVGPLAACFLPAFVLLGVVPVIAALAAPMLDWLS